MKRGDFAYDIKRMVNDAISNTPTISVGVVTDVHEDAYPPTIDVQFTDFDIKTKEATLLVSTGIRYTRSYNPSVGDTVVVLYPERNWRAPIVLDALKDNIQSVAPLGETASASNVVSLTGVQGGN